MRQRLGIALALLADPPILWAILPTLAAIAWFRHVDLKE